MIRAHLFALLLLVPIVSCAEAGSMQRQDAGMWDIDSTQEAAARRILAGIDRVLARHPARSFVQHYNMKSMHSDDTSRSVYHVTLLRDTANDFGYRIRGYVRFEDQSPFHVMYDGREALMGRPQDTLMMRIPTEMNPEQHIRGTFASSARFPHIAGIDRFEKLADRENVVSVAMRDSVWESEEVKVIELRERDEPLEGGEAMTIAARYLRIIVRARDTIPVHITEDLDIRDPGGMLRQSRDSWIEQLDLRPAISDRYFSREALPEYVLFEDYTNERNEERKPLQPGTKAPDFVLPVYHGDSIRLTDLRGKVVFMDFWYQSCYPCRVAVPAIKRLHEEFAEGGQVIFLGINPYDSGDDRHLQNFIESREIAYPVLLEAEPVAEAFQVSGYPTFFIVDREGVIRCSGAGYGEGLEDTFRGEIKRMLEQ